MGFDLGSFGNKLEIIRVRPKLLFFVSAETENEYLVFSEFRPKPKPKTETFEKIYKILYMT